MADATQSYYNDEQAVSFGREQKRKIIVEGGRIVQNDWLEVIITDLDDGQAALPPANIEMWSHNGGLTNTVDDNWNVSEGDTLEMEFWDPDNEANDSYRERTDGGYTEVEHTLAGGTDTAYTNAQLAASLNADENFTVFAYAVADITANRVTIIPKGRRGRVRVTGGTANSVLVFPGTEADNSTRTFTRISMIVGNWTATYNADTQALRLVQANATPATRVMAVVTLF